MNTITPIGITDWRNIRQKFGIKAADRLMHMYVIGKTGVGKSTLLQTMAKSDLELGNGFCILDGHGDLVEDLLAHVPASRVSDILYLNPGVADYVIPFNPLSNIEPGQYHLAASGLISTLKKFWADSFGPRMEHILRYSLLSLLEAGESSLLDIQPLLTNPGFREHKLRRVSSSYVLAFWRNEFDKYSPAFRSEAIAPILNKVGLFQAIEPLRKTVGCRDGINIREIMDTGKVLLCNLSKGDLGEDASSLLGSMLINAFYLAALTRTDTEKELRRPFYLFVDEAQTYATDAHKDIFSECRKFGLGLFMAHQFTAQLDDGILASIIGNCGSIIAFRIGAADSTLLAQEFSPVFNETDLINLSKHRIYLKMAIDGVTSKPFSAATIAPRPVIDSHKQAILSLHRNRYRPENKEAQKWQAAPEEKRQDTLF